MDLILLFVLQAKSTTIRSGSASTTATCLFSLIASLAARVDRTNFPHKGCVCLQRVGVPEVGRVNPLMIQTHVTELQRSRFPMCPRKPTLLLHRPQFSVGQT